MNWLKENKNVVYILILAFLLGFFLGCSRNLTFSGVFDLNDSGIHLDGDLNKTTIIKRLPNETK